MVNLTYPIQFARFAKRPIFNRPVQNKPKTGAKSGWPIANVRSKAQEEAVHDLLLTKYWVVAYQQCIEYRLEDGYQTKYCIPDFICGDTSTVKVIDAKLDYPDDEKMRLYISLVQHILRSVGDQRQVTGCHAFYESPWPVYSVFETIKIKKP